MTLVSRRELDGVVELGGVRRTISLALCPEAAVGAHVLVHAGYAIGSIDDGEARATLALLDEAMERGRRAAAAAAARTEALGDAALPGAEVTS